MAVRLGDDAPNFTAETTEGRIDFHQWLGASWGVLFSHPKDYTPVCTTELGAVAKMKPEFERRNVKIIAISVDPLESHHGWIRDINETQKATMNFPIIADPDRKVASLYDMIHPKADDTFTVLSSTVSKIDLGTGKSPEPADRNVCATTPNRHAVFPPAANFTCRTPFSSADWRWPTCWVAGCSAGTA